MINSTLSLLDGRFYAEFEQGDEYRPYFLIEVDVDQDDFNDFSGVEFDREGYVVADADESFRAMDHEDWFDQAEGFKVAYCKELEAYSAAQLLDGAVVLQINTAQAA